MSHHHHNIERDRKNFYKEKENAASMSRLSTGAYRERHSIQEKRMLRVSFEQIKEADPLGLKRKFKVGKDDSFLSHFYTVFALIPIGMVLGGLFYTLFVISPKT